MSRKKTRNFQSERKYFPGESLESHEPCGGDPPFQEAVPGFQPVSPADNLSAPVSLNVTIALLLISVFVRIGGVPETCILSMLQFWLNHQDVDGVRSV